MHEKPEHGPEARRTSWIQSCATHVRGACTRSPWLVALTLVVLIAGGIYVFMQQRTVGEGDEAFPNYMQNVGR